MHSTTNLHSRVHTLLVLPEPFPFDFHGGVCFLPEVCLNEVVSSVWVLAVLVFLSFTLFTLDSSVVMSDARISVNSCVRRMSKALSKARSFCSNSFFRTGSFLTPRMRQSLIKLSLRFIKPQCSERHISAVQYIENTSLKVLAYGIYARVVDVSEILLVRCAHSFDF